MTFIQPEQNKTFFIKLLTAIIVPIIAAVFVLIVVYNQTVTLRHGLAAARAELETMHAENAELQDALFARFGEESLQAFAGSRGLVVDKSPYYLRADASAEQWAIASHY